MNYFFTAVFTVVLPFFTFSQNDPSIFEKFNSQFFEIDGYQINVETLRSGNPIFFFVGGPGNFQDYMQGTFGHYYKNSHEK